MNLQRLFDEQRKLDAHINENHPPLPGEDRLSKKILALLVELGECANEWRGFKFWSRNQEANTHDVRNIMEEYNPLLEEYVDCLHFILSIGLELGFDRMEEGENFCRIIAVDAVLQFQRVFEFGLLVQQSEEFYPDLLGYFMGLGTEQLGFTWKQIEQAYMNKNATNHTRQESNY